ncbi:MAG TPA: Uma2 family endonuclease [Candidatus Cybelea sp.]|jgi:Uma2 family endonuclease|nr:Uma2 family endonuclease [Candidatus Cybelea sp.]
MAVAHPVHRLTEAEYLEIERRALIKSEFLDGEMFAMSGGTSAHSLIAANMTRAIGNQLEGSPCVVYTSDLRVKVQPDGLYTYPDLSVACGGEEFADDHKDTLLNPVVIVEILSDSREAYDRGKKFALYRQIPSLREYLLVSQHRPLVEQFIRQDSGEWLLREVSGFESKLTISSIVITIEMSKIYANVRFVPAPPPTENPDRRSYF